MIEGRAPNGEDIDRIIAEETEHIRPDVSTDPAAPPDTQPETPLGLPSTDEAIFDDTDEGPPGDRAGDPNIVQANSGNTPSRRGTGRREPTATEETRQSIYNAHREALERLEPNNPALTTLSVPGRAPVLRGGRRGRRLSAIRAYDNGLLIRLLRLHWPATYARQGGWAGTPGDVWTRFGDTKG